MAIHKGVYLIWVGCIHASYICILYYNIGKLSSSLTNNYTKPWTWKGMDWYIYCKEILFQLMPYVVPGGIQ